MRKYTSLLLFMSLTSTCFGQPSKEPRDFRGMEWDTHYAAVPGMVKSGARNEKIEIFKKQNEDMKLGPCDVKDLFYEGFNGRIFKAYMRLPECPTTQVFNMFKQKYGECTKVEDSLDNFICTWDWKRVKLEYAIDMENSYTEITYTYKITENEYKRYLKEKAAGKKDPF